MNAYFKAILISILILALILYFPKSRKIFLRIGNDQTFAHRYVVPVLILIFVFPLMLDVGRMMLVAHLSELEFQENGIPVIGEIVATENKFISSRRSSCHVKVMTIKYKDVDRKEYLNIYQEKRECRIKGEKKEKIFLYYYIADPNKIIPMDKFSPTCQIGTGALLLLYFIIAMACFALLCFVLPLVENL